MRFKIGDKLKVKKGCECVMYANNNGKYVVVRGVNNFNYNLEIISDNRDNRINYSYCNACSMTDEHLEPFEKTLENLEVGDLIVDPYDTCRRIIALCGEAYLVSYPDVSSKEQSLALKRAHHCWTPLQLSEYGYKPYTPPTTEIHELTIADVAKLKGVGPSQIKIID